MLQAGRSGAAYGRAARRGGGGARGAGPDANESVRPGDNRPFYPLHNPLEARTNEHLCKSMEEDNGRLTIGLSAVQPREDGRSSSLAADQRIDAYLSM